MKRRITREPDDLTCAAGIIPIAADTGRILLNQRGLSMDHAGEFACWGGYAAIGETPIQNAVREFHEESMYVGPITLFSVYIDSPTNRLFKYETFIGIIPKEFEPKIDDESMGYEWFTMSEIYGGKLDIHKNLKVVFDEIKNLLSSLLIKLGILNESDSLYNIIVHKAYVDDIGIIKVLD